MPRTLSVQSPAIPLVLGAPALEPVRLAGREGVNSLFEYELLLKTPDALNLVAAEAADFDLDAFIGREISCRIELDGAGSFVPGGVGAATDHLGAGTREINALVTEAALWGEEGRHIQYRLVLRPWLHLATLSTDCRIFQDKTAVQILDELLADYPYPVDKRLFDTYPPRDFQVQYNESDFAFFERICQKWGISYHFEHSGGKHRLVLSDAMGAYRAQESAAYREVDYHAPGWKPDAEYVHRFEPVHRLTSGQFTSRDYDYTRPRADLSVRRKDPRPTGQADGEVYEWHLPGAAGSHYAQPRAGAAGRENDPGAEGRQIALLRMQALRTAGMRAHASGNLRGMAPGCTFRLRNHPRHQANAEYLVLDTRFLVEDIAQESQPRGATEGRSQRWRVEVDFTAHPVGEPLRPALVRTAPRTSGPVEARVVGPAGENLWTDALGRIKVQFPWDRRGRDDQHSSCWVRVSAAWAGNQLGAIHIPRIGQEVLVSFLDGDPDRPVCTGRVYNQANLPPYQLPQQAALSGFRSRALGAEAGNSAAGPSNHILMDDTAGEQQVQIQSDHRHSSLSLGSIRRIEDNAGRKEARGEGFEVRTDGWGAVRSERGLLLTTDGRTEAVGGMLSRDELITCLERALFIAKDLGRVAAKCEGAQRDTEAQQNLGEAVDALGHGANDEADATGRASGGQPVLALSGAAGLAMATPQDFTQFAGVHIDTVAGKNQQHYAGRSILHSAGHDIEQFAHKGEIRHIASEGKVIQQAQHNGFEITAQKGVDISSTEDGITIRAKKSITLALEDGTCLRMESGKVDICMGNSFTVHSASHRFVGAATLPVAFPRFYKAERDNQAQQLLMHRANNQADTTPQRKYRLFEGTGEIAKDESGSDATSKLGEDKVFNVRR